MRIAIFALGSQGDVQPYVALGKGLQAAGHAVRLVSQENYAHLISSHGLALYLSFVRVGQNLDVS
jgi:UDP:flavonoid glycosyltransferase YjiC (YdhE family)